MNLYLVNKIIQNVMDDHIDYETGEITEEGAEKLKKLGIEKELVIHEMLKAYKNAQLLIDGISMEVGRLIDRKSKLQKTQVSIVKQVRPMLTEGEKVVTPEYELKWTTSSPLVGLDTFDPELEYNNTEGDLITYVVKTIHEPTYAFDKNAIKQELKKEGSKLPLDVYINTTKNIKIQ